MARKNLTRKIFYGNVIYHANVCMPGPKMRKAPITIKDIARIVGVSHSTVSRSLNDSPLISEETKQLITSVAKKHNFDFNANARGLSSRRTGSVGIIFPDFFAEYRNSLYLELLMNDLRRCLESHSLDSIVMFPFNHSTGISNIKKLIRQKKVDGLLIVLPDINPLDWSHMKQSGIPFVLLHVKPVSDRGQKYQLCPDKSSQRGLSCHRASSKSRT